MRGSLSRLASIVSVVALLALTAACGGSAASKPSAPPAPAGQATAAGAPVQKPKQTLPRILAAYPAVGAQYTPLFVGVAEGFYAKNGVDVKARLIHGSTVEASALLSGSVQAAISEENVALTAMAKGAGLVLVGSDFDNWPLQLWAKPSIKSVAGLKGKRLGLGNVGSAVGVAADQLLAKFGIKRSQVKYDFLGGTAERVAALISGKVDAIIISPPNGFKAQAKGFTMLYDMSKLPHMTGCIEMTRAFVRQHPKEVTAFLKGHIEAVNFIKNPANRAKVLAIMRKYTKVSNPKLLAETYRFFLPHWQRDPTIPASLIASGATWVQANRHVKVDVAQAVDLAPLKALEKSGFVARAAKAQ